VVVRALLFNIQKEFLNIGFINYFEFMRNVIIRFIARIVLKSLVKVIYKQSREHGHRD
jgi:hypothetical protein